MQKKIALDNGRSLIACYSRAQKSGKTWLVFVPESAADFQFGHRKDAIEWLGPKLARHFHYLALNKPGVEPNQTDIRVFESSFRRPLRVKDYSKVLKTIIPKNHEILLVGYSEGAYLAPQLARLDRRIVGLVMIGGGTRGWLKEELSNAHPRKRRSLKRQIQKILKNPTSQARWNGFTFATWNSYRGDHTLTALKKLDIPTLGILGARDRTIDFKTTWSDLRKLSRKKPVAIRVLANCGHSFVNHWPDARHEIRMFIGSHAI